MTEDGWNRCTEPQKMLAFLQSSGRASDRKFRLFARGCCRRIWDCLPDPCNRDLVAAVEDHPDGHFHDPDLEGAIVASSRREWEFRDEPAYWVAKYLGRGFYKYTAAGSASAVAVMAMLVPADRDSRDAEAVMQAGLLREIFGPLPFRGVAVGPSLLKWRDGTVPKLAQAIYDERRFGDLPVLADALEESGCDEEQVLTHCWGPGPHAKGCWVLDLLTQRA
jgi:hypothetical protein